jgi:cell division protein FtsW
MNSTVMKAGGATLAYARSGSRTGVRIHLDWVTVGLVLAILLLGLVMVTSASISIASKETGDVFFYLERQLILAILGCTAAAFVFCLPTRLLERLSMPLLIAACALLLIVLIPGLGYSVNGSRRWVRLLGFNFQVSELTRVFVLIYLASYAVRRSDELRGTLAGIAKPWACSRSSPHCCCWSRTSARRLCCSAPVSACCSWPARASDTPSA